MDFSMLHRRERCLQFASLFVSGELQDPLHACVAHEKNGESLRNYNATVFLIYIYVYVCTNIYI